MPRTFDRKQPANDKNPLRNDLDYDNPGGMIQQGAEQAGDLIHNLFAGFGKLFNLPTPQEFLAGIASGAAALWDSATDVFIKPLNKFANLIGGFLDGLQIPILDPSKILNLPALFDNFDDTLKGIFNGWFGGGGTGTVAEVTYTIESIKDAIIDGWTVVTFTSDTANWTVPLHAVAKAGMISGGQNGDGNFGGLHGSFMSVQLDLTGISSLDIRVGTAGNKSYVREANTTTPHTGTIIAESAVHGSPGGIAGPEIVGLVGTASLPGSGGNGGTAGNDRIYPEPGYPSSLASGGAAGTSTSFGGSGGAGGSVSAGSLIKCGGGGGGGGGGAGTVFNTGGNGGAGGYPGGGGGGRGNGFSAANGSMGPGAPGVVWIYYK